MIFLSFLCKPLTTIPYWAMVQEVNSSEQDKASCPAVGLFFYALFRQRKKNHSFSVVSGLYSSRSPGCISSSLQNASMFSHDTGLPSRSFWSVDWLNSLSFLIRYRDNTGCPAEREKHFALPVQALKLFQEQLYQCLLIGKGKKQLTERTNTNDRWDE